MRGNAYKVKEDVFVVNIVTNQAQIFQVKLVGQNGINIPFKDSEQGEDIVVVL